MAHSRQDTHAHGARKNVFIRGRKEVRPASAQLFSRVWTNTTDGDDVCEGEHPGRNAACTTQCTMLGGTGMLSMLKEAFAYDISRGF